MPLKLAKTRGVGVLNVKAPMPTGQRDVDLSLSAFAGQLAIMRAACGVVLTPVDNIASALKAVADGDRVLLLPGTYVVSGSLDIDKSIVLEGHGATLEFQNGSVLRVSASDAVLSGLTFSALGGALPVFASVSGDRCEVRDCKFAVDGDVAVLVSGNYCGVQGCRFSGTRTAAGADIYYADGATYGIVCGTMWNGDAATFSLDYRAIDNTSEAANGPAAIINVR